MIWYSYYLITRNNRGQFVIAPPHNLCYYGIMKINLAKSAGFCFGVKRALKIAFELAKSKRRVEMLGNIVHNEKVVNEINKSGIKKVNRLRNGKNKILLIPAHGTCIDTIKKAKDLGYKIIDATCPMVKQIHKIAVDQENKGYRIIVIGDKKHDEVRGVTGQLKNKSLIIDSLNRIPFKTIRHLDKACVVAQSTQNLNKVLKIVGVLKPYIKKIVFFNTICIPTRTKQKEIKTMPLKNDVMVIIGSKTSANTKRLYEISKSLNKQTHWVQSKREIKPNWFKTDSSVGVTSGASTPDSTTQEIINYIKQISNAGDL
ncbi:MAG: 4-hydroxy-3-methylbut-2-enyl diphosphate reductase [Candidatus Omnitrophota bacterium]